MRVGEVREGRYGKFVFVEEILVVGGCGDMLFDQAWGWLLCCLRRRVCVSGTVHVTMEKGYRHYLLLVNGVLSCN